VNRLCDQAGKQNTPVTYFYFDFVARKEQSVTSMLGSLLRQIIGGLERIPEEISGGLSRAEDGHWWTRSAAS